MLHDKKVQSPIITGLLFFLLLKVPVPASAQNTFSAFTDSALVNNSEAISIRMQLQRYDLETRMISAVLQSTKMYLSSDILLVPYFNNNGNLLNITPSGKAIGYDAGVANNVYSALFNIDLPVLKRPEVKHMQLQNELEKTRLNIRLKTIKAELQQSIGSLYFDAMSKQAVVINNRRNTTLLNEQLHLVKQLVSKGLYRISDYKLMQLELQSDSVMLSSSINDLELAVRQLKAACGIQNSEAEALTDPSIEMTEPVTENSLFVQPYRQDSLSAVNRQQIFKDQYRPQINVFANSGLNSTSIPNMEQHMGISAGVHLSYTLFDGHQKKINEQQQMLAIDEASTQKEVKLKEVKNQAYAWLQAINQTRTELEKQKQIQNGYNNLLILYRDELQEAQISVIDFIAYLKKYSDVNLAIDQKKITLEKLINEYNYWNH